MKQADYWKNRFTLLEDAQNQKALEYYSTLDDEFTKAARNIDKELASWYSRYAKNEGITFAEAKQVLTKGELSAFKMSVEDYIKKGKTLNYSDQWAAELERASVKFHVTRLEAIQLQMQQQVEMVYGHELDSFDGFISSQYKAGYYKTMFEIQKGFGVGFDVMKLDDNKIAKLIAKPWAADGMNFSSRIWRDKNKLMAEMPSILTQATIRGDGYDKTTKLLAERFNVSKSQAKNLVVTESAFFSSESQADCFNNLGVKQYEIVATLDSRTSSTCRQLDGKVFDMKDRKSGITSPPFHGRCRTCTAPFFNDEFEINTKRAARNPETGKTYRVPADMKYPDWEKSFIDGDGKDGLEVAGSLEKNKLKVLSTLDDAEDNIKSITGVKSCNLQLYDADEIDGIRANTSLELAKTIQDSFNKVFSKYPDLRGSIDSVKSVKTMASFTARAETDLVTKKSDILLNNAFFKDGSKYLDLMSNSYGELEVPYSTVMTHEIGHIVDNFLTNKFKLLDGVKKVTTDNFMSNKIKSQVLSELDMTDAEIDKNLSKYATLNNMEFFAEAFWEYIESPEPRAIASAVGSAVDKMFKEVIQ